MRSRMRTRSSSSSMGSTNSECCDGCGEHIKTNVMNCQKADEETHRQTRYVVLLFVFVRHSHHSKRARAIHAPVLRHVARTPTPCRKRLRSRLRDCTGRSSSAGGSRRFLLSRCKFRLLALLQLFHFCLYTLSSCRRCSSIYPRVKIHGRVSRIAVPANNGADATL